MAIRWFPLLLIPLLRAADKMIVSCFFMFLFMFLFLFSRGEVRGMISGADDSDSLRGIHQVQEGRHFNRGALRVPRDAGRQDAEEN